MIVSFEETSNQNKCSSFNLDNCTMFYTKGDGTIHFKNIQNVNSLTMFFNDEVSPIAAKKTMEQINLELLRGSTILLIKNSGTEISAQSNLTNRHIILEGEAK
jgi:hypothetical protein